MTRRRGTWHCRRPRTPPAAPPQHTSALPHLLTLWVAPDDAFLFPTLFLETDRPGAGGHGNVDGRTHLPAAAVVVRRAGVGTRDSGAPHQGHRRFNLKPLGSKFEPWLPSGAHLQWFTVSQGGGGRCLLKLGPADGLAECCHRAGGRAARLPTSSIDFCRGWVDPVAACWPLTKVEDRVSCEAVAAHEPGQEAARLGQVEDWV